MSKKIFVDENANIDDLFDKMKPKQTINDQKKQNNPKSDEYDTMDAKTRNVVKYGYDYYKILGVEKKASKKEINTAYKQKLAKFHPDKYVPKDEQDKRDNERWYKLIREAGTALLNDDRRKMYDLEKKTIINKDFSKQKHDFEEFIKLQESEITDQKREIAKIQFNQDFDKMNKRRGYDPESAKVALTKHETKQRYEDLIAQREMQEIELTKPNRFEGRAFNPAEFNKMFEKNKRHEEKREKQRDGQLTKYQPGMSAFNDTNLASFTSIDANYDDLYAEDDMFNGDNTCDKVRSDSPVSDISYSSSSEDDTEVYYDMHNKNRDEKDLNRRLEELMEQRRMEGEKFDNMKHGEFKDAMDDPFGISKDFGYMLGKTTNQVRPKVKDKINYDMINLYNRRIQYDDKEDN